MGLVVLALAAGLAGPPAATLHTGQTKWFLPGQLEAGDRVACVGPSGRSVMKVPAPLANGAQYGFAWGGAGPKLSISLRSNGAAQVDCGTRSAAHRSPTMPYVVGRNGLGLLRGTVTLASVRTLYGPGTATARGGSCRVVWPAIGLTATFAGCTGASAFTGATVTGSLWSSLSGVRVGDSVARLVWEDQHARRFTPGSWLLGGVGRTHPPRLLALVGKAGTVAGFRVVTR